MGVIDDHHRFGVAVTAAAHGTDSGLKIVVPNSTGKSIPGLQTAGGNAAGGQTDDDLYAAGGGVFPAPLLGVIAELLPHVAWRILAIVIQFGAALFQPFLSLFEPAE
jgi:hypothetical protein